MFTAYPAFIPLTSPKQYPAKHGANYGQQAHQNSPQFSGQSEDILTLIKAGKKIEELPQFKKTFKKTRHDNILTQKITNGEGHNLSLWTHGMQAYFDSSDDVEKGRLVEMLTSIGKRTGTWHVIDSAGRARDVLRPGYENKPTEEIPIHPAAIELATQVLRQFPNRQEVLEKVDYHSKVLLRDINAGPGALVSSQAYQKIWEGVKNTPIEPKATVASSSKPQQPIQEKPAPVTSTKPGKKMKRQKRKPGPKLSASNLTQHAESDSETYESAVEGRLSPKPKSSISRAKSPIKPSRTASSIKAEESDSESGFETAAEKLSPGSTSPTGVRTPGYRPSNNAFAPLLPEFQERPWQVVASKKKGKKPQLNPGAASGQMTKTDWLAESAALQQKLSLQFPKRFPGGWIPPEHMKQLPASVQGAINTKHFQRKALQDELGATKLEADDLRKALQKLEQEKKLSDWNAELALQRQHDAERKLAGKRSTSAIRGRQSSEDGVLPASPQELPAKSITSPRASSANPTSKSTTPRRRLSIPSSTTPPKKPDTQHIIDNLTLNSPPIISSTDPQFNQKITDRYAELHTEKKRAQKLKLLSLLKGDVEPSDVITTHTSSGSSSPTKGQALSQSLPQQEGGRVQRIQEASKRDQQLAMLLSLAKLPPVSGANKNNGFKSSGAKSIPHSREASPTQNKPLRQARRSSLSFNLQDTSVDPALSPRSNRLSRSYSFNADNGK